MLPVPQLSHAATAPSVDVSWLLEKLHAGGFVLYRPHLARRLGHFKAALFMGHALYWTRYVAMHHRARQGWFFMTSVSCRNATGLSRREQETCRRVLGDAGLVLVRRAGHCGRLHYQVQLDALARCMDLDAADATLKQAFGSWMSGATSFYKPLADVSGSVASGLYLSYLLHTQRGSCGAAGSSQDGFFQVAGRDVAAALGFSEKISRNARAQLLQSGLISQRGTWIRIELARLAAQLVAHHSLRADTANASRADVGQRQQQNDPMANFMQMGTVVWQEAVDGSALCAKRTGPFRHSDPPFAPYQKALCAKPYKTTKTIKTTTKRARSSRSSASRVDDSALGCRCSDGPLWQEAAAKCEASCSVLRVPPELAVQWHGSVLQIVQSAPVSIRQKLLDELAGRLRLEGNVIHNPAGWVQALVKRYRQYGQIDWSMAAEVTNDRRKSSRGRGTQSTTPHTGTPVIAEAWDTQPRTRAGARTKKVPLSDVARTTLAELKRLRYAIDKESAA